MKNVKIYGYKVSTDLTWEDKKFFLDLARRENKTLAQVARDALEFYKARCENELALRSAI